MEKYDLIVIGAGPGGTPAAMAAAQFGKKVLLVDKRNRPGGECLFEGCIPSKVLENAANRYSLIKESELFHIDIEGKEQIHWDAVLKDKEEILQRRSMSAMKQIEALPTLTYKTGTARFIDLHTLDIEGVQYSFTNAIIATGASAHIPDFKGNGASKAWSNASLFKEANIPEEITFVGAGAISCELVQMLNKLGTRCHILERGTRILKHIDEECAMKVQEKMIADGIIIDFNVVFDSIDEENGSFTVTYHQHNKEQTLHTSHLLIAAGRAANTKHLGLENIGIEFDRQGIRVNETLQTTQEHIYAVGDCAAGPKFAHWASYCAGVAIHNIFAPHKHTIKPNNLSWVLFSDPQIASAGLSESQAKEQGLEITTARYDYATDARAQIDKAETGLIKFVIEKQSGIIRGIQILSEDASSLSGEAALIVAKEMKAIDVMSAIHPHPTLAEGFGKLSQMLFMKSMLQGGK